MKEPTNVNEKRAQLVGVQNTKSHFVLISAGTVYLPSFYEESDGGGGDATVWKHIKVSGGSPLNGGETALHPITERRRRHDKTVARLAN